MSSSDGLSVLKQGVCHRELNLESALLHRRDARSALQIKVCEFGLSRVRRIFDSPLSIRARAEPTTHQHGVRDDGGIGRDVDADKSTLWRHAGAPIEHQLHLRADGSFGLALLRALYTRPATVVRMSCAAGLTVVRPAPPCAQAALLDSMPLPPHAPLQPPLSASKPYEGAAADVFTCGVLLYRLLVRFAKGERSWALNAKIHGRRLN
jgi:serine/threonine protein kinase